MISTAVGSGRRRRVRGGRRGCCCCRNTGKNLRWVRSARLGRGRPRKGDRHLRGQRRAPAEPVPVSLGGFVFDGGAERLTQRRKGRRGVGGSVGLFRMVGRGVEFVPHGCEKRSRGTRRSGRIGGFVFDGGRAVARLWQGRLARGTHGRGALATEDGPCDGLVGRVVLADGSGCFAGGVCVPPSRAGWFGREGGRDGVRPSRRFRSSPRTRGGRSRGRSGPTRRR